MTVENKGMYEKYALGDLLDQRECPEEKGTEEEEYIQVTVKSKFIAMEKGGAKCIVQEKGCQAELIIRQKQCEQLHEKYPVKFRIGGKLNSFCFWGRRGDYKGRPRFVFAFLPTGKVNG